jgi:hypothetical protein
MMLAALVLWAVVQDPRWTVRPAAPTVGDTVWLERRVTAPGGWAVRPGRLAPGGAVEPIGDPVAEWDGGSWVVRYPVVAWTTGTQGVTLPVLWRLGPGGEADSLAGGQASFTVASVLPDTGRPAPRPARDPLRLGRRGALGPAAALGLAAGLLAAGVRWRRRRPRPARARPHVPVDRVVPDGDWIGAGEPAAVAARAAAHLRAALARAVPAAHTGLTTAECLAALKGTRPGAPLDELATALNRLDQAAFGGVRGADVAALAAQSRALAKKVLR